jgi:hypothetical protein
MKGLAKLTKRYGGADLRVSRFFLIKVIWCRCCSRLYVRKLRLMLFRDVTRRDIQVKWTTIAQTGEHRGRTAWFHDFNQESVCSPSDDRNMLVGYLAELVPSFALFCSFFSAPARAIIFRHTR